MNAWPVVCMTALAISKLALLMRSRISRHTPTHASGPALRHARFARLDRRQQAVEVRLRIRDAERACRTATARRRPGRPSPAASAESGVEQRVERGLAGFGRAFAVDLRARRLGKRRPVAALGDRLDGAVERRAMAFEKGCDTGGLSCVAQSITLARDAPIAGRTRREHDSHLRLSRCRSGRSRR